jgi:hypothetical protein
VIFLRFAVSGLFGIVVMRAGGAIDRHPDLLTARAEDIGADRLPD